MISLMMVVVGGVRGGLGGDVTKSELRELGLREGTCRLLLITCEEKDMVLYLGVRKA